MGVCEYMCVCVWAQMVYISARQRSCMSLVLEWVSAKLFCFHLFLFDGLCFHQAWVSMQMCACQCVHVCTRMCARLRIFARHGPRFVPLRINVFKISTNINTNKCTRTITEKAWIRIGTQISQTYGLVQQPKTHTLTHRNIWRSLNQFRQS